MIDYKMPKILREIFGETNTEWLKSLISRRTPSEIPTIKMSADVFIDLFIGLRTRRILSTPSERDEQETQISYLKAEVQAYKKCMATPKALLDKRRAERDEQEKRIEKLEAENKKLQTKLQDVTHAGKCASIGELNAGIEIEDLKIENEELKAEVERLKEATTKIFPLPEFDDGLP